MARIMRIANIRVKHDYADSDLPDNRGTWQSIAMNITGIRRKQSLTQEELADLVGVSQGAISRAEAGDEGVTLRHFQSIAEALNVPLAALFQDDRTKAEDELIALFRQLPFDRQQLWLKMSRTFVQDHQGPTEGKQRIDRRA